MAVMQPGSGAGTQSNLYVTYNRLGFLKILRAMLAFERFTKNAMLPQGLGSHTGEWFLYGDLAVATTPLIDGANPAEHVIANPTAITATIQKYGAYIKVAERLDLTKPSGTQQQYQDILARQAAASKDQLIQTEALTTSTIVRAGGQSVSSLDGAAQNSTTTMGLRDVARLYSKMRSLNVEPHSAATMGASYVAVVDPQDIFDLKSDAASVGGQADISFWNIMKDAAPDKVLKGSVGAVCGIEFVTTTRIDTATDGNDTVRRCLVFGDESIGSMHLSGRSGIRLHNKRPGPQSTDNPLDQFQTFGWSFYDAFALLDANRLIKFYTV